MTVARLCDINYSAHLHLPVCNVVTKLSGVCHNATQCLTQCITRQCDTGVPRAWPGSQLLQLVKALMAQLRAGAH